jgi:CheY-like chemotaxis protein
MTNGGQLRFVGRSEGDATLLAVQDTGAGMTEHVLEEALEPFFTTKGTRGTGLGLSEVYGITRRQGGNLELESWPGVGTTVLLRFPAVTTAARRKPAVPRQEPTEEALRILVVDDNVLGLEALAAALRNAGHTVVTASSGEAAMRVFEPSRFGVVLTDLGMPALTGWELLDPLRRRDPDVRLGVITGWAMERGDHELREREIELIFLKPVNIDELRAAL